MASLISFVLLSISLVPASITAAFVPFIIRIKFRAGFNIHHWAYIGT
jgi:hypothetical protein